MSLIMSKARYDELWARDDTNLKVEEITLPAKVLDVTTFTGDETGLSINTEMGIESLNMPGPVVAVTMDSPDKLGVSIFYWEIAKTTEEKI